MQLCFNDYDKFFNWLFDKAVYVMYESDIVLKSNGESGIIHYPYNFYQIMNSKPMLASARKLQLSLKVYYFDKCIHTRMEHGKGTYFRLCKIIISLYQDPDIKRYYEQGKNKKYLIGYLLKALLHDVGHGPLSHTFETITGVSHSFHEKIGERIIREDPEIRSIMENIDPEMLSIIDFLDSKDPLGFNKILEGQSDVDRDDYYIRDNWYLDGGFDASYIENKYQGFSMQMIDKEMHPVYALESLPYIEAGLLNRFNCYYDVYLNKDVRISDYIFQMFGRRLLKTGEVSLLSTFLRSISEKNIEVDLLEFIKWDDVSYFTGIFDVYNKTNDPILKELGLLSLPNKQIMDNILLGTMISHEQNDEEVYSLYYQKLKNIHNYYQRYPELNVDNRGLISSITSIDGDVHNDAQKRIFDLLGTDEIFGYVYDASKIKFYKKSEPIYIYGRDGIIYEYSEHPDRTIDSDAMVVKHCSFAVPNVLLYQGYSFEKVEKIKKIIS